MIAIYFILEGKDYAFRVWPAAPRVGDFVMMHPVEGPRVHEVLEIVWGVKGNDEVRDRVTCNIRIGEAQFESTPAKQAKS